VRANCFGWNVTSFVGEFNPTSDATPAISGDRAEGPGGGILHFLADLLPSVRHGIPVEISGVNHCRVACRDRVPTVRSATFQDEVALVAANQAYGAGTMIGQWFSRLLASCPEAQETYLTATIAFASIVL
jgi:hypothetical protein